MAGAIGNFVSGSSGTDASSYTFTSVAAGGSGNAYVIVGIEHRPAGGVKTVSTVTWNGHSLTRVGTERTSDSDGNGSFCCCSIWITSTPVPVGTSGDLVVTLSGTTLRCFHELAVATGIDPAGFATAENGTGANPTSTTVNVPQDGILYAVAGNNSDVSATWSGATESADAPVGAESNRASTAFISGTAAETGRTISVTWAATGGDQALKVATFSVGASPRSQAVVMG